MNLRIARKQKLFIDAQADEVLFGGAAGPGKSYGQLIDAMLYALKYPGSKQLILRRTFPELEKSLIRTTYELYPKEIYRYNASQHMGRWKNGSLIDFAYCDREHDVYKYQSAEYDVIRFDELTHFTETMYTYLMSRVRGVNNYPKSVKSSTNPGGIGHAWVKARFVDIGARGEVHQAESGTRLFIPALLQDNPFLLEKDPDYPKRLENLSERDKQALIYGNWDIFEGQYFTEFDRELHVVKPFMLPKHWRRYVALDYGLDMLACYWVAVDEHENAYVYRELYKSGLIVSDAARAIKAMTTEELHARYAPPDLWNRHSDSGISTAELFAREGVPLIKVSNQRVQGWYNLHEWLRPYEDEQGRRTAHLKIFENCTNLIRALPALQHDDKNPNDTATEPHEITHAPDALRYFVSGRPLPAVVAVERDEDYLDYDDQVDSFVNYGR